MKKKSPTKLNFKKLNGLIPAIVQDFKTREVLMLGFMNEEALKRTAAGCREPLAYRKSLIWRDSLAGRQGFEPRYRGPESGEWVAACARPL